MTCTIMGLAWTCIREAKVVDLWGVQTGLYKQLYVYRIQYIYIQYTVYTRIRSKESPPCCHHQVIHFFHTFRLSPSTLWTLCLSPPQISLGSPQASHLLCLHHAPKSARQQIPLAPQLRQVRWGQGAGEAQGQLLASDLLR